VEEDTYTTGQAARILEMTDRGIRKMIDRGELEAHQDDRGRHLIPQRAVHAMLEERRGRASAVEEIAGEPRGAAQEAAELRRRVEHLQRELGRLEGRLELTERTESTMREERERLIADLVRERERADQVELEARRLRAALEEARKPERPWWRRMFGG
jgi:excisionase family DNA binding protein